MNIDKDTADMMAKQLEPVGKFEIVDVEGSFRKVRDVLARDVQRVGRRQQAGNGPAITVSPSGATDHWLAMASAAFKAKAEIQWRFE